MKRISLLSGAAALALVAVIALPLWSEDKPAAKGDKAVAEDLMKLGPEHAKMAEAAGTYDVICKCYAEENAPAKETKGTAEIKVILDGRFLQENFQGEMDGKPFTGLGISGYDRIQKKFVEIWCDSVSGIPIVLSGTASGEGSKELRGQAPDPKTGKLANVRMVCTKKSADEFLVEMYCDSEGKEAKKMELLYRRRAS